ncbi:hypothetical protein [Bhargavaea cecembensis]|uniref:hypothetical protein n=1 Tax=Bhargavaea cecembensis TaxID=394098 RepID=UPI00058F6F36|nr:hypothetical protein [Bhargavaea cecembensis]
MNQIRSIRFEMYASGPISPGEERVHEVEISRSGAVTHEILTAGGQPGKMDFRRDEYRIAPAAAADFLDSLITQFHVDGWIKDYGSPVLDGWSYEVTIRYADGRIQGVRGSVDPPPGAEGVARAAKELVPFRKEPWIF